MKGLNDMLREVVEEFISSSYPSYRCEVVRVSVGDDGFLASLYGMRDSWYCGYVIVPNSQMPDSRIGYLSIHGGVTFCEEKDGKTTYGFDFAHAGDFETPPDLEYVKEECHRLAKQIYYWHLERNFA